MGKLTRQEFNWVLYDVGNSAFILLVTTILPIYFDYLAEAGGLTPVQYMAYWGYAMSLSTLIAAFLGPVLGAVADTKGYKKPIFAAALFLGVAGCMALALAGSWLAFLGLFVVAKVGYGASLVFYDGMMPDVTGPERFDVVSSMGYGWGYIGSCIPFGISLILVLGYPKWNISFPAAMAGVLVLNGIWWLLLSIPLLRGYRQIYGLEPGKNPVRKSFVRLAATFGEIKNNRPVCLFLAAFFLYIDGVYTIMEMATAYGSALGLGATGLLLALLLTQIIAFPCALAFGQATRRFRPGSLIKGCIVAYVCIALFGGQMERQWEFWVLAICVGMFQGGIQALSRSYYSRLVPPERAGEYFGIFDICGKGASILGTALMGVFAQITGEPGSGVVILTLLFLAGLFLFSKVERAQERS